MHIAKELAMSLGDINGHVGRHIEFGGIHGGHGVGQMNLE